MYRQISAVQSSIAISGMAGVREDMEALGTKLVRGYND
jgi:hypothetical protein